MNIHITLVGGQTAPVYLGIIDSNPDKVILIYSEQTEDEANRISTEMNVACELCIFHPVDLIEIEKSIQKVVTKIGAEDFVSINIGGGTKPWSILFYEHFKMIENSKLMYIDQNNLVWDLKTRTNHQAVFNIDVQFRLYGNPLTQYKRFDDYSQEDRNVIAEIKALRAFNFRDFNYMTDYLSNHTNENTIIGKSGSIIEWLSDDKAFRCSMKNKFGKELNKRLQSENIRSLLLNTGWFELQVAVLLSSWKKAKELRLNCVFPSTKGSPKNEIDIIINTGTKLLFVECKTQIFHETDIDKFASAVKVYGGLGSKAVFITDAPMSEKAIEKCNDHGILPFSLQSNNFSLSIEKLLFMKLENELFNINAK